MYHLGPNLEQAAFIFAAFETQLDRVVFRYQEWFPVPSEGFESRSDIYFELGDATRARVIKYGLIWRKGPEWPERLSGISVNGEPARATVLTEVRSRRIRTGPDQMIRLANSIASFFDPELPGCSP